MQVRYLTERDFFNVNTPRFELTGSLAFRKI